MHKIIITKYNNAYKHSLLVLLSYMWKDLSESERKERFDWRYENNPYSEPYIYLAFDGEQLIAFRAFIAQVFKLKKQRYLVFSPSDTIVHPAYRRKGIMSWLNKVVINEIYLESKKSNYVLLLNTTTSRNSMPVYIKEHWQKTHGLKKYYFKYSLSALLKHYVDSRKNKPVSFSKKDLHFEVTNKICGDKLAIFNEQYHDPYIWSPIRDEAFYKWRYAYKPEQYIAFYTYKNSSLQAYLILKRASWKQYALEEYGAIDTKVFTKTVSVAMKRLQVPLLRSWAFSSRDTELLKKAGFYPEPVEWMKKLGKERLPILVRPNRPTPNAEDFVVDGQDIRQIENWQIQLADRH